MKNTHPISLLTMFGATLASCGTVHLEGGRVYDDVPPELPKAYVGEAKNLPIYQILVYSFADSNGDGIGDFQGIIDKLDYLSAMNVGYLWLSPVHPSPSYHHYDVLDYYAIDEAYGGLEKFKELILEAKKRGIGIMMDMVFNHASDRSQWFRDSCKSYARHLKENTLEQMKNDPNDVGNDFVLRHDHKDFPGGAKIGTIWADGKQIYYEANFSTAMPEFDLTSPSVKLKQVAIMRHYLKLGVAGFRFDGCRYFMHESGPKSVGYMDFLALEARKIKPSVVLVGEYWDGFGMTTYHNAMSQMPIFNFPISNGGGGREGSPAYSIRSGNSSTFALRLYRNQFEALNKSGGLSQPVYFLNNHDMDRYNPPSDEEAKVSAASYLLTPGTPTIYYGEEIALKGSRGGSEHTDASRRLPMQWYGDRSKDTARCRVFDGVSEPANQVKVGALEEMNRSGSLTDYYRKILALRSAHPEIQNGTYSTYGDEAEELSINRIELNGETKGFLVHNFDYDPHMTAILPEGCKMDTSLSLGQDIYDGTRLRLAPYSTVYLEVNS